MEQPRKLDEVKAHDEDNPGPEPVHDVRAHAPPHPKCDQEGLAHRRPAEPGADPPRFGPLPLIAQPKVRGPEPRTPSKPTRRPQ